MFTRILISGAFVLALAIGIITTGDALARKGGNGGGGNYSGTIAFASSEVSQAAHDLSSGDSVMFAVDAHVKDRDLYNLWVENRCSQGGVTVSLVFAPVDDGLAGPIALEWMGGGAAECTTHVETFEGKPISGASMTYSVGP